MNKKRISVLLFWFIAIYTINIGYNVLLPSKNQKPTDLIEKTVNDINKGINTTHQVSNIGNIDKALLDKYEFHIAIDLSKSVNAELTQVKKDKILIGLISKIKSEFLDKGLNVRTYFFGSGIIELSNEHITNFSLDKLEEYKKTKFLVDGKNYQLQNSTDIISALQTVINNNEINDKKEKLIVFITDDIHTTFDKSVNIKKNSTTIYDMASKMNNTSFILYKYPGVGGKNTTPNLIQNHIKDIFEQKSVRLENIAKELVSNLQLSMYIHDLTTIKGNIPNDDIPFVKKPSYKKYNSTICNSRFRAEFLGKGMDRDPEGIKLYPNEKITFLNFKFINDYTYFPIKINLKEIEFWNDSLTTINFAKEIKVDNSKYLTVDNFILNPNESKTWIIPVHIAYDNSLSKNLLPQNDIINYLKIDYELEFLGKNKELYSSLYKNNNEKLDHSFSFKTETLHFKGNQINQLQSTLISGEKENLLIKTYPPTILKFIIGLLATILYLFFAILIRKPTINNWTIKRDHKKMVVKRKKSLKIEGDIEDPLGDVVIKAYKFNISFNPFISQPKDTLIIDFKYGADKIDKEGYPIGNYKGKIKLNSNNRIRSQIYDDIILEIY